MSNISQVNQEAFEAAARAELERLRAREQRHAQLPDREAFHRAAESELKRLVEREQRLGRVDQQAFLQQASVELAALVGQSKETLDNQTRTEVLAQVLARQERIEARLNEQHAMLEEISKQLAHLTKAQSDVPASIPANLSGILPRSGNFPAEEGPVEYKFPKKGMVLKVFTKDSDQMPAIFATTDRPNDSLMETDLSDFFATSVMSGIIEEAVRVFREQETGTISAEDQEKKIEQILKTRFSPLTQMNEHQQAVTVAAVAAVAAGITPYISEIMAKAKQGEE